MPHCSIPVSPMACVMARPTFPPLFSIVIKIIPFNYLMGQIYNVRIADESFENVAKSKYLETRIIYDNHTHD
jgi:hypothetical protein